MTQQHPIHQSQTTQHQNIHQEKIIYIANTARRGLISYYLVFILAIALVYSLLNQPKNPQLGAFIIPFVIAVIILFFYSEIRVQMKKLTITNRRAILKDGILRRHSITINYSTITDISLTQSFFERILGIGDLSIHTSGAKKGYELTINKIGKAPKIKESIEGFMGLRHHYQ